MKIALVINNYMIGGGLINLYRLVKALPNIEFALFAKEGKGKFLFRDIKNIKLFNNYNYKNILNFKPDIVHFNDLKSLINFLFYDGVYKKNTVPLLFTAHGLHIHKYEFSKKLLDKFKFYMRFLIEKFAYSKVSKVIAVSKEDQNWLITNYKLKNVVYIPNGIDCKEVFLANKTKLDEKYINKLKNKFIFFTIARLHFQKGYDILVKAIHIANKKLPSNIVFVFLGGGPDKEKILKMIKKYELDNRIVLINERVSNSFLWNLGHVFILPSRWEGLPTVVLEAGCYKKLVIASSTYGIRELIQHNKNGLLFPVEDENALAETILKAYKDFNKLSKLGNNLHKLVISEYTIEKMAKKYENLYMQLVKN